MADFFADVPELIDRNFGEPGRSALHEILPSRVVEVAVPARELIEAFTRSELDGRGPSNRGIGRLDPDYPRLASVLKAPQDPATRTYLGGIVDRIVCRALVVGAVLDRTFLEGQRGAGFVQTAEAPEQVWERWIPMFMENLKLFQTPLSDLMIDASDEPLRELAEVAESSLVKSGAFGGKKKSYAAVMNLGMLYVAAGTGLFLAFDGK